jgi:hypothetical protein
MDKKQMCANWKNAIQTESDRHIRDPYTQKWNKKNTPYFRKKIKNVKTVCKELGIDIFDIKEKSKETRDSPKKEKSKETKNTKDSQDDTLSFSKIIEKSGPDYDIQDAIRAFMQTSDKKENDAENVKREFLMTILHLKNSEKLNISDEQRHYLKLLEDKWSTVMKEVFDVDIYNSSFEVKRRSGKRNFPYDLRIKFEKNGKIINKRIDLKVSDYSSSDPPQFKECSVNKIPIFKSYTAFFYDHFVDKIIHKYNTIFDDILVIPSRGNYIKNTELRQCSKKDNDYFAMIKRKTKGSTENDKTFKKLIDEITKESISAYMSLNIDNIDDLDLSWLIELLNKKKNIHYFMWSRKDRVFNYITYKDDINNIISSIKNKNIIIKKSNYYPRIVIKGKTKDIEILLRWSNGNGVCNPSVKISWKKSKKY